MTSYKIYLSKSPDVISAIARGFELNKNYGDGKVVSLSHGGIIGGTLIPEMYHNCGYVHCKVEYETPASKSPKYEIIFA